MKATLIGAALCLVLTGCATKMVPAPKIELPLPASAMVAPPELDLLADDTPDEKSRWIAKTAPLYDQCVAKVRELSDYIQWSRGK